MFEFTARDDPPRPATTRYSPLIPATVRYGSLGYRGYLLTVRTVRFRKKWLRHRTVRMVRFAMFAMFTRFGFRSQDSARLGSHSEVSEVATQDPFAYHGSLNSHGSHGVVADVIYQIYRIYIYI